jgi:Delta7-sterol 5-desaturase
MVLCEISAGWGHGTFLLTWVALSVIGLVGIHVMSGVVFYYYYSKGQVTFEKWQRKSNPKFPAADKVRDEIVQMIKGMFAAVCAPTMAIYLAGKGTGQGYCGSPPESVVAPENVWLYHIGTFFLTWLASDFFEFFYHRMGHTYKAFWNVHKAHHVFFNPSPFAVIADEYIDQFVRSLPLFVFPLLMPVNIDMLFFQFMFFFYTYGVYLHWGYETPWLSAHNPVFNTSFQHYCHHAKSIIGKPYHCGFMFKIWDQLFGCVYKGECFCAVCDTAKGNRTKAAYQAIMDDFPDYSVLLKPSFWLHSGVLSGLTSKDQNTLLSEDELREAKIANQKTTA